MSISRAPQNDESMVTLNVRVKPRLKKDLREWTDEAGERSGLKESHYLRLFLRVGFELRAALKDLRWHELQDLAKERHQGLGATIAELALDGLAVQRSNVTRLPDRPKR